MEYPPMGNRGRGTRPPRGYKLPKPTHGVYAPYVIEPVAETVLAWVTEVASMENSPVAFLAQEQFRPALDRWARSEARRLRLEDYVMEHGEMDDYGSAMPAMASLLDWEKRSSTHAERLGLDPVSLAKIRKDLAEAHRDQDAADAMSDLQQRYAKTSTRQAKAPEVVDGQATESQP